MLKAVFIDLFIWKKLGLEGSENEDDERSKSTSLKPCFSFLTSLYLFACEYGTSWSKRLIGIYPINPLEVARDGATEGCRIFEPERLVNVERSIRYANSEGNIVNDT